MAIPAYRTKRAITLPDGTQKVVMLTGDENKHFYQDADGNAYKITKEGQYELANKVVLQKEWAERFQLRNKHRIERAMKRGIINRETGMLNIASSSREGVHRAQWGAESNPVSGSKKGLVILVNFSDKEMTNNHNQAFYNDYFNLEGFSRENAKGSVHDYFMDCSYGKFDLTFDVVGPVKVSKNMSYYGQNDQSGADMYPATMVAEACKLTDELGTDFSKYDWDGDGEADQVYIVYAGYGENMDAPTSTIWPHESTLSDGAKYMDGAGALKLDGVTIDTYAVSSELTGNTGTNVNGIGMACHEFSHCMGIPDMYDINGQYFGMFVWDVMDYGSYSGDYYDMFPASNCPSPYTSYERMYCGWLTPKELKSACTIEGMKSIDEAPEAYIIYNDKNKREFYLLENRQNKGFYASDPAHGMLILHVDFNSEAWINNIVNSTAVQRCTIIPADNNLSYESIQGDTWPGIKKKTELTDTSTPAATLNSANTDGRKLMGKPITYITESNGLISFAFNGGLYIDAPIAKEATDVTSRSFTANWDAIEGATAYELELTSTDLNEINYNLDDIAIMKENFEGFNNGTESNGLDDVSNALDKYTNMPGWEGREIYTTPRNEIRLGASKYKEIVGGSIYSPYLPTTTKTITVTFVARSYSSDTAPLALIMGELGDAVVAGQLPLEKEPQRVTVTASTDTDEWWFALQCAQRCYVSEMAAYEGYITEEQMALGYVSDKREETKRYPSEGTNTSYTFDELTAERSYSYRVRALIDKAIGEWSDPISVNLPTGIFRLEEQKTSIPAYFDLQGRLTQNTPTQRGIYITNGKKILK